ncbi:hypothetical protein EXIGLDRAFT_725119 [Exidia glandulosa HHB12029]|uniref:Uncharacterized protein n=1 Tax=Exidia glandulosa HHB12029 TaxID=1314781 RepID=A0A165ZVY8_EXIGL|nr:hypothetical protein EXIGLDRAFT_725119 [Exidia glandulosa HHB12029]
MATFLTTRLIPINFGIPILQYLLYSWPLFFPTSPVADAAVSTASILSPTETQAPSNAESPPSSASPTFPATIKL